MTDITKIKLPAVNTANEVDFDTITGEGRIDFTGKDFKTLIMVTANAAATVTFYMGNGIGGVYDLAITLASGDSTCLTLDSSSFKNVSGDNKGFVVFKSTASIDILAIELP